MFSSDHKWDKVQYECIKCLKAYMNNKVGLKDMIENKEALTLLARSIMPNLPHVMLEATKLMAAVCIIPPGKYAVKNLVISCSKISRFLSLLKMVDRA